MNKLCECGCGKEVTNEKNRFLWGHSGLRTKPSIKATLHAAIVNTGKKRSEETKLKISKSLIGKKKTPLTDEQKNRISKQHKGKKISEEQRLNHIKRITGKKHSEETKRKMSNSAKLRKGLYKHSPDTIIKMSINAIKRVEERKLNGLPLMPNHGNNEISILDQLQNSTGIEIIRNSRQLAGITGKFNDGFIHKYNLSLDVLEQWHFKSNGELRNYDKKRELIIAYKLSCMIYYISEQEFLSNPEKEIQRFKDFLLLLDEGKN